MPLKIADSLKDFIEDLISADDIDRIVTFSKILSQVS